MRATPQARWLKWWTVLLSCLLLATACSGGAGLFDSGTVTVSGPASWANELGEIGSVLEVANETKQTVQIVEVAIQPGIGEQAAFEVIDAGREMAADGGDASSARRLPPGPLEPLPLIVEAGQTAELFVRLELRSCDAVGEWHVDPDSQTVVFATTVVSPFKLHFADGDVLQSNVFPNTNMLQSLEPAACERTG